MYSELLVLTDEKATYEQFIEIEAVYMSKEEMTKEQAARLWKRRYGVKESKPRPEEMRRIKKSIREFKREQAWAKEMEQRINKKYDDLIPERLMDFYGKTLEEINNEPPNSTIAYLANQTLERIEKERNRAIFDWYDSAGGDATFYIIYKDGSTLYVTGTEIVGGDVTPKIQGIVYANYSDGYEEYDTEIGDRDMGLYGKTAEEHDYEITDDMLLIRDKYERTIEIKYGADWGLKQDIV